MVKKTPAAISHTKESKLPINGASLIPRMFYHFLKRYLMSNENGITERLKRIIQANASLSQELQESKPLINNDDHPKPVIRLGGRISKQRLANT
ncbi:hypothetical protein SAY87_019541 [Trapa incisa]|uniref:Uncharacterized protein n=1 Tax=Trapa incisa TaxID=236973 RepID=A0AAN7Q7G8_9MYRT|nr:hypothetical protein SAY87_019541 [Trapa incisa]